MGQHPKKYKETHTIQKRIQTIQLKMSRGSKQTFFQSRYKDGQHICEKVFNIINCQANANQNHSEFTTLYLLEWLPSKSQNISVAKNLGEKKRKEFGGKGSLEHY